MIHESLSKATITNFLMQVINFNSFLWSHSAIPISNMSDELFMLLLLYKPSQILVSSTYQGPHQFLFVMTRMIYTGELWMHSGMPSQQYVPICVLLPLITRLSNTSEVLVASIAANELLGYKFCTTNSGFLTIFKLTKYCEVLEAINLS